jgi:hypothetical protein
MDKYINPVLSASERRQLRRALAAPQPGDVLLVTRHPRRTRIQVPTIELAAEAVLGPAMRLYTRSSGSNRVPV